MTIVFRWIPFSWAGSCEVHVDITREVLTIKQVAELLQVSPDMVYRLAAAGQLRGRKIGRIWRFSKDAIEDFMRDLPPSLKGDGDVVTSARNA